MSSPSRGRGYVCVPLPRQPTPYYDHQSQGVIVTGGGTGLGFAIAKELVGLGAQVVIAGASSLLLSARRIARCSQHTNTHTRTSLATARNLERLEKAAEELNAIGKGGKVGGGYVCMCM